MTTKGYNSAFCINPFPWTPKTANGFAVNLRLFDGTSTPSPTTSHVVFKRVNAGGGSCHATDVAYFSVRDKASAFAQALNNGSGASDHYLTTYERWIEQEQPVAA